MQAGSGHASSGFHVDKTYTTMTLIAGRDVDTIRTGSNPPDLWIAGGELIEKSLLVKGNIIVHGTLRGNVSSEIINVDILGEKTSTVGIDVVSDMHFLPGTILSVETIQPPPDLDLTLNAGANHRVLINGDGLDMQCSNLYNVGNIINVGGGCSNINVAGNIVMQSANEITTPKLLSANIVTTDLNVLNLHGLPTIHIQSNTIVEGIHFDITGGGDIRIEDGAQLLNSGNVVIRSPTGRLILENGEVYIGSVSDANCHVNLSILANAAVGNIFYSAGPCDLASLEIGPLGAVLTVDGNALPVWSMPPTGYLLPVLPVQGGTGIVSYSVGEMIYASGGNVLATLSIGSSGDILMVSGGVPSWQPPLWNTSQGGTGITTYITGDIIYASAANILSKRAIGSAGQILTVSGGIPVWQAPLLSSLPITATQGGTGQTGYVSGDILYATSATTLGKRAIGSAGQVLLVSGGLPTWGAIPLVPISSGGTNITTYTTGDLLYASAPNVLSKLPASSNGYVLTLNAGLPSWQPSVTYPIAPTLGGTGQTTYTTGELLYASAANTLSKLTIGTAGYVLTVVGGIPQWQPAGGVSYPITAIQGGTGQTTYTTGELLYASATNVLSKLSAGASGQVLTVIGGLPSWQTPAIDSLPVLPTQGGTGLTTYAAGDLIYASSATVLAKRPIGTPGQVLTVSGGNVPTWVSGVTMGGDISGQSTAATVNNISGQPAATFISNTVGCGFSLASTPFRTTYNQSFTVAPAATQNLISLVTYNSFSYFGFILEAWVTCRSTTTPTNVSYPYGAWRWEMAWASPLVVGWNGGKSQFMENNCSTQMDGTNSILQGVNSSGFSCIFYVTWTVYGL